MANNPALEFLNRYEGPKLENVGHMYVKTFDAQSGWQAERVDTHPFTLGRYNISGCLALISDEHGGLTLLPATREVSAALQRSGIEMESGMGVPFSNGGVAYGNGDRERLAKFSAQITPLLAANTAQFNAEHAAANKPKQVATSQPRVGASA